ncbi:MAG: polysaccharide biosynthesis protein, partial [Elusimicrobiota bacterium]
CPAKADIQVRFLASAMDGPGILIAFAGQPRQNEVITCQEQMAKNLILLSWLEPGKDIQIRFTGLKQGEKMDEELIEDLGSCDESEHPSIMVLRPDGAAVTDIQSRIVDLEILSRTAGAKALVEKLRELTPTFVPAAAHRIPD